MTDNESKQVVSIRIRPSLKKKVATYATSFGLKFNAAVEHLLESGLSPASKRQQPKTGDQRLVKCGNCGHTWNTKAKRARCSKCKRTKVTEVKQKRKRA